MQFFSKQKQVLQKVETFHKKHSWIAVKSVTNIFSYFAFVGASTSSNSELSSVFYSSYSFDIL